MVEGQPARRRSRILPLAYFAAASYVLAGLVVRGLLASWDAPLGVAAAIAALVAVVWASIAAATLESVVAGRRRALLAGALRPYGLVAIAGVAILLFVLLLIDAR